MTGVLLMPYGATELPQKLAGIQAASRSRSHSGAPRASASKA